MNALDLIYTGVVCLFSICCIVYGIKSAIQIRHSNIKEYKENKENKQKRKEEFNNYEHKN